MFNIEIKTVSIDEKKLTKSLFSQLPWMSQPYYSDYSLVEEIVGYVNHKEIYLLIQREGKLYRSEYRRRNFLYCSKPALDEMEKPRNGWKDSDGNQEVRLCHFQGQGTSFKLDIPNINFGDRMYLQTTIKGGLPIGYQSDQFLDPDPEIIESNSKILSSMGQIFLKA